MQLCTENASNQQNPTTSGSTQLNSGVWVDFRCEFRNISPIWMHMSGGGPRTPQNLWSGLIFTNSRWNFIPVLFPDRAPSELIPFHATLYLRTQRNVRRKCTGRNWQSRPGQSNLVKCDFFVSPCRREMHKSDLGREWFLPDFFRTVWSWISCSSFLTRIPLSSLREIATWFWIFLLVILWDLDKSDRKWPRSHSHTSRHAW
jgi:hypothetical protein